MADALEAKVARLKITYDIPEQKFDMNKQLLTLRLPRKLTLLRSRRLRNCMLRKRKSSLLRSSAWRKNLQYVL